MRLLVTGGSGFVGCNFIRYILQHYGPEWVTNVDALTTGRLANLEGLADEYGDRYEFLHAAIADRDRMEAIFEKHQYFAVVHFAAEASGMDGAAALLEQARRHGVRRFLLASREGAEAMLPVEIAVLNAHRDYGQETVITRTTHCYGPCQAPPALIPQAIIRAMRDQRVPLAGDGARLRDWLHVEDYCAAAFTALLDGQPGTIHHVGSGHELRDIDLVHRILEQLGKGRDLVELVAAGETPRSAAAPAPAGADTVAGAGHGGDGVETMRLPTQPTQNTLPWKPRHAFDQGLRETIDWYVRNREWWESLPRS